MRRTMKTRINHIITVSLVRAGYLAERHLGLLLFILGTGLLVFGLSDPAIAQTGGGIFREAASNIACKVLPGKFGAMLSAFAGVFALIAAATGSYRGAWALVFVSIGAFIFKEFVAILFGDTVNC